MTSGIDRDGVVMIVLVEVLPCEKVEGKGDETMMEEVSESGLPKNNDVVA